MSREVKVGSLDRGPSSKRGQDKDRMWQLWGIHDHASLLANRPGAHHGAKYECHILTNVKDCTLITLRCLIKGYVQANWKLNQFLFRYSENVTKSLIGTKTAQLIKSYLINDASHQNFNEIFVNKSSYFFIKSGVRFEIWDTYFWGACIDLSNLGGWMFLFCF